jgi:hypothetical protein
MRASPTAGASAPAAAAGPARAGWPAGPSGSSGASSMLAWAWTFWKASLTQPCVLCMENREWSMQGGVRMTLTCGSVLARAAATISSTYAALERGDITTHISHYRYECFSVGSAGYNVSAIAMERGDKPDCQM